MDNYYTLLNTTNRSHLEFVGNLTNIEPNDITILFFRDDIVTLINKILIDKVKKETLKLSGKILVIEEQSKEHIYIIMRYIFFKYVNYNDLPENEVNMLIDKTIEYVLPTVLDGLYAHLKYLEDMKSNFMPSLVPYPVASPKNNPDLPPRLII
jgi:hypothetical protein